MLRHVNRCTSSTLYFLISLIKCNDNHQPRLYTIVLLLVGGNARPVGTGSHR